METQETRGVILDTDILIKLIKEKKLSKIVRSIDLYISLITLYEYLRGLKYLDKDLQKEKQKLERSLTILWPDNKVIVKMSEIWFKLRRKGTLIDERDLLIGATAITHNLPLWTMNQKHFVKLKYFNLKIFKSKMLF